MKKKEFNFKKAKKVGNRFKDKDVKISVTSRLDSDVVFWLKSEAEKRGLPYQTFMNSLLKQAMSGTLTDVETLRKVIREELKNKKVV
ncbi:MAG: BrnA antitoxin family protein [Bdellovibrionales bacterium]|nr:BrnA antitoxin family protein [Bdellovibrionales bacterium]